MTFMDRQLFTHILAAERVDGIIDSAFSQVTAKSSEKSISEFIGREFESLGLVSDKSGGRIVAFNENSAEPHYRGREAKKIRAGTLILIDAWARVKEKGAIYADLSKVAFYGEKIPPKIKLVFNAIILARDNAISFTEKSLSKGEMPVGREIDSSARAVLEKHGFGENFIHSTGHSMSPKNVHGGIRLGKKSAERIDDFTPYTIEPGVYFKGKFGMRSEIDFLARDGCFALTSHLQRKILLIKP